MGPGNIEPGAEIHLKTNGFFTFLAGLSDI